MTNATNMTTTGNGNIRDGGGGEVGASLMLSSEGAEDPGGGVGIGTTNTKMTKTRTIIEFMSEESSSTSAVSAKDFDR